MNERIVTVDDTTDIDLRSKNEVAKADYLSIANNDDCKRCIDYEDVLKQLEKGIREHHDKGIKMADALHDELLEKRNKVLDPVISARKYAKAMRIEYTEEQERIRKAEESRIQAEARRLIEEAALAAAIAAEEAGDGAEAEAIINEPVHVPTVTLQRTTPSAGISGAIREVWSAEVYDLHGLLVAIVEGKASIGLIEPNMTALNGMARSLKSNMSIPGVKAVSRKV